MKEKGDECIFVGYSTQSKAYRVFNKRTRVIMESIHVNFDELPLMASDQISSDPAPECQTMALNHDSLSPAIQRQGKVTQADRTVTMLNELDLLFSPMFDELLNGSSKVMSKSSAVSAVDAPNQRQQYTTPLNNHTTPAPTCQVLTPAPTVISSENINQAETYAENDQVADDEFINIFSTPVIGNPSQPVRTRRQLESNAEMCMFVLTVSRTEPKNIKETMADSAWIESMQEELHQFDRLDSRAYRVFNKRTRVIMESIHVNFNELPLMASDRNSSDPVPECQTMTLNHDSLSPTIQRQEKVTQADRTVTTSNELDLLFSLMFDELLNGSSKVVSKSSAVSTADAPIQQTHAENDQVTDDEFINIFSIPVQDQGETSSRYVDSSNMHTFYQRFPSEHRWTKDHPLKQVIRNPLQSVRTRRQLESDDEMCMFTLTVSRTKPKNIKEAMADST
nr:Gag-Pol polyprotein [Tanacetum cinerariifolium]